MNPEVWALVGVVVGAILGGLAQIVAERVRQGHSRRTALRDERRSAYTELLVGVREFLSGVAYLTTVAELNNDHKGTVPIETFAESGSAIKRLESSLALVQFVAPNDTYLAAKDVYDDTFAIAGMEMDDDMPDARRHAHRKLVSEFMDLARRDLGIS